MDEIASISIKTKHVSCIFLASFCLILTVRLLILQQLVRAMSKLTTQLIRAEAEIHKLPTKLWFLFRLLWIQGKAWIMGYHFRWKSMMLIEFTIRLDKQSWFLIDKNYWLRHYQVTNIINEARLSLFIIY